jgi:glycerol-3-phosphate acyltransferase PlsX
MKISVDAMGSDYAPEEIVKDAVMVAKEYLVEGEHPAYALRKKRNASIIVATKLVKEGKA